MTQVAIVIDDHEYYRRIAKKELDALGYSVRTAKSIREILGGVVPVDLVVCDIYMHAESITPLELVTFAQRVRSAMIIIASSSDLGDVPKTPGELTRFVKQHSLREQAKRLKERLERCER